MWRAVASDGAPGPGPQRDGTPQAQQHKRKYRRWQRETPIALWPLDLPGGIFAYYGPSWAGESEFRQTGMVTA
jgi:hypothetical protein